MRLTKHAHSCVRIEHGGTTLVLDPGMFSTPEDLASYRQVFGAVDRLPEAQRLVMLLVAVEGLTYHEAARVLDVPVGTVISRLSRARRTIGEQFRQSGEHGRHAPDAGASGSSRSSGPTFGAREEDA